MTDQTAERLANALMAVAAAGAAYYILRTPSLRRMAWGLARTAIAGSGPAWLVAEAARGWNAGAEPTPRQRI